MDIISKERAADIRARCDALAAWMNANKRNSYTVDELRAAGVAEVSNEERGALELYEWFTDIPERYFAYVKEGKALGELHTVTTFMGDSLGHCSLGPVWRSNLGDRRRSVILIGTNGARYHGTYYCDAGTYCRLVRSRGRIKANR